MELTVEKVETMAKQIRAARAAQDRAAIDKLTDDYASMGIQLYYALQLYAYRIVEAACCNNAQRLRELHDQLLELRKVQAEWRLVDVELGIFTRSESEDSGGGSCLPCAPAASFTEGRDA